VQSPRSQAPWRDERDAREFLGRLADALVGVRRPGAAPLPADLVAWLERHDLAAPVYFSGAVLDADFTARLRPAALSVAASNRAHFEALDRIEQGLAAATIPVVLLKGAALAHAAYGGPSRRPMSDLDLWIGRGRIAEAVSLLRDLGYREERHADGETQLRPALRRGGLVELHESAFRGWWIRWTASVDEAGAWQRATPCAAGRAARRLAPEDEVIQLACHLVTNHVAQAPLRGLLDLALVARSRRPDWAEVADRAARWRLATAVWLALDRAERLIGLPGADAALARLRPSLARRLVLSRVAAPFSILTERSAWTRRPIVPLVCADRVRDAARMVRHAAWPARPWLVARYGARGAGRLAHLRSLVGSGRV